MRDERATPRRSLLWRVLGIPCRVLTTLMFDLKVYGKRNVPRHGGALLVANHQSFLDPVLVAVALDRPISFFARSTLFDLPVFGWLIRTLHAFPVRRGKADRAAIQEAIDRLTEGHVLNIYPEGTRTETGDIRPILPGVALIVRKAGVPVIPVAIHGSFHAWPKGCRLFHSHPIRVRYGPPLKVEGLKADQIVQLIEGTLRSMLADLREEQM